MSPICEYIDSLPVAASTKYFAMLLAYSGRKIYTQKHLSASTNFGRRMVRYHLYRLIECGVISRRREGNKYQFFITDIRLIHHMAAEKQGFKPITINQ